MAEANSQLDIQRVERSLWLALALQIASAVVFSVLAGTSHSQSLFFLSIQAGLGVLFWLATISTARLRSAASQDAEQRARVDQQRQQQGLQNLFDDDKGRAQRNLEQWERVVAPLMSLLIAALLLIPIPTLWLISEQGLNGLWQFPKAGLDHELLSAALCILFGFAGLSLGTYVGGLSRLRAWSFLRAGAAILLMTTVLTGGSVIALAVANKWSLWLDRVVGLSIAGFMALQGTEIIINVILDLFRPRISGVEQRLAFDSRLSGWLAEPKGVFASIAHTLDYQFGFKVSETWFYRFLERAFAPLLLIQILTFYAMTCFLVVRPGERAIIERFGAPRGVKQLPKRDSDWDSLEAPLEAGLHVKWPWPFETVRVFQADQMTRLHLGFNTKSEQQARSLVKEMGKTIVSWDRERINEDIDYLLPLSQNIEGEGSVGVDCMVLNGNFTIEYKIGSAKSGDIYRYAYAHKEPKKAIRGLFERELTAYFAGAQFWDLLVHQSSEHKDALLANFRRAAIDARLGIHVVSFHIEDVRPPSGVVGRAYQSVLASLEQEQSEVHGGEARAISIIGETPAQVNAVLVGEDSRRTRRVALAKAKADQFSHQSKAYQLAPEVYKTRKLMRVLERSLGRARKFVVPKGIELRFDRSQVADPVEQALEKALTEK